MGRSHNQETEAGETATFYELEYLKPVVTGSTLERFVWETPSGPAMAARLTGGATVVRAAGPRR